MKTNKQAIGVVFLITLLISEINLFLSNDMYIPAMDAIMSYFKTTDNEARQTLSLWFFGSTSLQLLAGPIIERYGYKSVLVFHSASFALSSFVCSLTSNISVFLVGRFIQGTAICFIMGAGYSLIYSLNSGIEAIKKTSTIRSISIVAPAFGPTIGALFIKYHNWQGMFLIFTIISLLTIPAFITSTPNVETSKKPIRPIPILKSYSKMILKEPEFLKLSISMSFNFMFLILWIVESANIIINIYKQSEYVYGLIQLGICLLLSAGNLLSPALAKSQNLRKNISLIMSLRTLLLLAAYLSAKQTYLSPYITGLIIGVSFLLSGILNNIINSLAIESSREPVSMSNTMISMLRSLFMSCASALAGIFLIKKVENLFLFTTIYSGLALLVFTRTKVSGLKKHH